MKNLFDYRAASRSVHAYIMAALFLLLLVHVQRGWVTIKDDAFITFRYAEHLAEGKGIVWNPGEGPVEGYTNFLFMVIMAVFALFKADLVIASKIVNLLSAIAIFFMIIEMMNRIYKDRLLLYFGLFLFSFPYFTAAHVAAGLETMFYAMLVTLAVLLLLRQLEAYTRRRKIVLTVVMLLLGLTRPEGVLVAGVIMALEFALVPEARRKDGIRILLLCYFLPGVVYMLARRTYFHYWLPNPFYIKKSTKTFSLVGLMELQEFIKVTKIFIGLALVPFMFGKARKQLLVLSAVFLPSLAVYMFFRPMMNYAFRYYQPYYALMIPVMAVPLYMALNVLRKYMRKDGSPAGRARVAEVGALVVAVLLLCPYIRGNYFQFKYWRQQGPKLRDCHIYIGKLLGRFPEYRNRYIALGDAGAISYYSKWKVLDLGGLNDVYLAHHGESIARELEVFSTRLDLDYVFAKDPAVIMLASSNPMTVDHYASRILAEDPRLKRYKKVLAVEYSPMIYEILYFKKGDPQLAKLRIALEESALARGGRKLRVKD
jgi:hypothetical protein